MFFVSQDNFEHVDFHLPLEKKAWYRLKHEERRSAASSLPRHPRSEEHDEKLKDIFGHDNADHIVQMKLSEKNKHWTFLFHDAQEMQLVFNESKQLTGARFRHDHVSHEAIDLLLDALVKQGYDIYADNFVETGLNITGNKKFIHDARETLKSQIAARQKLESKNAILPDNASEEPPASAPDLSPTPPVVKAEPSPAKGPESGKDAPRTDSPRPTSTLQTSLSLKVGPEFISAGSAYRPEVQADLLEVVTDWAWYLREELNKDLGAGKLVRGSAEYTKRLAESDLVNKIETVLSGAKDEVTGKYPSLPETTLSAIKRDIGPKGEDPLVIDSTKPNFPYIAQKLGIQPAQTAQQGSAPSPQQNLFGQPSAYKGSAAPPQQRPQAPSA